MIGRKTKSISFDLSDEFEKNLLEHTEKVEKGKFSRYIKRLIAQDRDGGVRSYPMPVVEQEAEDDDSMNGFL